VKEFKDRDGNRWKIDLTFGTVLRVKSESEGRFNLLEPEHDKLRERIAAHDFEALYELLWLIVRPQAEAKDIDAAKFGELMAADCLFDARQVLWGEWTDFFRQLQRPDQATVLEKLEKYNAKAMELVKAKLSEKALTDLDARVETEMATALNKSFGKLQESLESTLGPSP
jgi:hypothetical protein